MSLPILYKKNEKGKYQQWRVWADGNKVMTEFGQVDGKLRIIERIAKPTNVGRANARDENQQAIFEAESKWREQKEKNLYSETKPEDIVEAESSEVTGILNLLPSLAHPFEKYPTKTYPVAVQPKLDGLRSIVSVKNGTVVCTSRNNKEYAFLTTIKSYCNQIIKNIEEELGSPCALDGEVYSHNIPFEKIVSIGKQLKREDPDEHLLQLWVFDIIITKPMPFNERWELLSRHINTGTYSELLSNSQIVNLLPYEVVNNESEIDKKHEEYIQLGFEGLMVREINSFYEHKRTRSLLKLKKFYDEEFEIVGAEQGEGLESGCVIWVLKDKEGNEFKARPRGSQEVRKQHYINRTKFIGKQMTVRYQEKSELNIPRFPVAICVRDYE